MTPRFIFDENVVILAQQVRDEHGNSSLVCTDLVLRVIEICHTIVVDDILWKKYLKQLNRPSHHHPTLGTFLVRSLRHALNIVEKVDGIGHAAPIVDDEGSIPQGSQDDAYLVRLAVETGATLVTTDGALHDDLASCGLLSKYSLTIVSPKDALGLL